MKRMLALFGALLLVVAGGTALWFYLNAPSWPTFDQTESKEPRAVWQMKRDYASHIGDLVQADLFINQRPGTQISLAGMEVKGDFEIAGQPELLEHKNKDGSITWRVRLSLQSFAVKPKLTLKTAFQWGGENGEVAEYIVPPLELYTSNTWDGRPQLKEGETAAPPAWGYWLRFGLPLAGGLTLYLVLSLLALMAWVRKRLERTASQIAASRFQELMALVGSGQSGMEDHAELDRIVREHWKLGPVPYASLLASSLVPVSEFLGLNALAIYPESSLPDSERAQLTELGVKLAVSWDKPYSLNDPFAKPADGALPPPENPGYMGEENNEPAVATTSDTTATGSDKPATTPNEPPPADTNGK